MIVGVCRIALSLDGVSSLKEKRAIVRRVVDRARSRFNAAVAEVEAQDVHQRAILAFAVVGNEGAHCDRMLEEIVQWVEALGAAPIAWRKTQRVPLGDMAGKVPELDAEVLGSWDALEEAP